jgi:glycosyltransferase involved in cell wall biosynthesis
MNLNRIIFWEPCLSPHKIDLICQLNKLMTEAEIMICSDQGLPKVREDLGWSIPHETDIKTIVSPSKEIIKELTQKKIHSTVHIFSGTRNHLNLKVGLKELIDIGGSFGIMSEPRVKEGLAGLVRYAHSFISESRMRDKVKFILAIGKHGPPWFKSIGYAEKKIFPFAYFIDPSESSNYEKKLFNSSAKINICFIGRLIKQKGLLDLVRALRLMPNKVTLTIVGSGSLEKLIISLCNKYSIQTNHLGVVPNGKINAILSEMDILVLPSITTDDGWGVVVSEALMMGVAVIVSDKVGSSVVFNETIFGIVFESRNYIALRDAIIKIYDEGLLLESSRKRRMYLARAKLSAKSGAEYLSNILTNVFSDGKYPKSYFNKLK